MPDFAHKQAKGFGKWAAHHYPTFLGVPLLGIKAATSMNIQWSLLSNAASDLMFPTAWYCKCLVK